ncbi:hypothetical protein VOLCADRAFT_96204 [Volvox carteri f. nagariensis]|uniref:Trigger factor ribosome-binding bacterial domain-containing protein n=1 Tax=Volvox carteri f. nagariensis TaxID=3068 RepID=D8U9H7_VOLCA|nr:uncharacterized protein VOLCADRAFT_96204 [Volvox carteri f. nagariensis]EFJ43644.1 hypothetical protein VOLCADRAFT_96204 [Volvox carteri f. nagariensis]|eukprot:XP_002955344.1 hypothetical protein VOLCADRAFT_96204 [Volvox carteri f. nagariensis]
MLLLKAEDSKRRGMSCLTQRPRTKVLSAAANIAHTMMSIRQHPICGGQTRRPACTNSAPAVGIRCSALTQAPAQLAPARFPAVLAHAPSPFCAPRAPCPSLAPSAHPRPIRGLHFDVSVSVEELSLCRRKVAITVPARAVKDVFKRGVKRLERDVIGNLRGWQAGKPLPLGMVISKVGGQEKFKTFCLEELLLEALPRGVEAARQGRPVDPASVEVPSSDFPSMLERYDPATEFSFNAHFDVAPPVVWAVPLEQLSVTIKDTGDFQTDAAAADDLIRQYRKQHGFSRVAAGRGLQTGDTLVMDMEVRSESSGQPLPGLTHTRISFDTEQDVLGITSGMLGMKVGESRTFKMMMPEDYEVEFWQNMPVVATVKVHEIFEWTLPEFNDAYVEQHHAGKWRSAAEMREALIASTAMQRLQQLDKQLEDAVVKAVADSLAIPEVPARMVEQLGERQFQAQLLQMIEDVGEGSGAHLTSPLLIKPSPHSTPPSQRIGSQEDIEKLATEEVAAEFIAQRRKDLEDQVKFNLAVDDIFVSRGLELDEGAVEAEYDLRVRQMQAVGQPFEREELLEDVRETVKSVTVIEWLKDNIKREVLPYNCDDNTATAAGTGQDSREPVAV